MARKHSEIEVTAQKPPQLLDLIEHIPCALWEIETDAQGRAKRFTFLSNTAELLFGHPHEFLLHPPNWEKIVHPDDLETFRRISVTPFPSDDHKTYRHRIVTADGRIIPIEATVTLLRDSNGVPVSLHGVTLDVSEQYRSIERWKMLARTTEAFGELVDIETTIRTITQIIVPSNADICSIFLKNETGELYQPAIAASRPELEVMLREARERFPGRAETRQMILRVLESKQSFAIEVTDEFRRANSVSEEHYEFQKRMDIRSAIITPLFVENELLGVILLSNVGSRPSFTEEDRLFIEELARHASVAISNVRLLAQTRELAEQARREAEERKYTQDWVELLSYVSISLASDADVEAALRGLATEFVPRIADFCAVLLTAPGEKHLESIRTIARISEPKELAETVRDIAIRFPATADPFGIQRILTSCEPQIHLSYSEELLRSFSRNEEHMKLLHSLRFTSSLFYPLVAHDRVYGAIIFARSEHSGRRFEAADVTFVEEIARRASLSLYKANLLEEAQTELENRTRLQRRVELLEEISQRVARSLDLQELLRSVSSVIAPRFADWLTVDLLRPNSRLERIFIHHSDSSLEALTEEYRIRFMEDTPNALHEVLRSGDPVIIPFANDRAREAFGINSERWAWIQQLGAHSCLMVPLRSRRRTVGILGFDYGHSGRQYGPDDLEFAVEIASRVAAGVDNALLFEEASKEIARRTELQLHLEQANEEAEVANRTKDQFIATLSHELRTPLTPVLTTIDLLAEDKEFPASLAPYLEVLRRNIQIEVRLIDDLLDMTRIAKGKLRFVEGDVDLHVLVAEVMEMCEQEFDRGSLRIVTRLHAANPFVRGDRDRLSQVLWNLLHNATKFTPEGGVITIRTQNFREEAITLEIEDTGLGIDPAELSKIFEPFEQRTELRRGTHAGLGLGLAISRNIVEMHGGTIEARSLGAGHGATFSITLKVTQVANSSNSVERKRAGFRPKSGRILMVDDHLDTNTALKVLLERRGYEVITAASVAGGLELARQYPFDVLVSDIGLPDGDGTDLLRAIRDGGEAPCAMRAIAVSGYGSQADIDKSIAAGFKYHLKKPIAFPDLERAIAEVLAAPEP